MSGAVTRLLGLVAASALLALGGCAAMFPRVDMEPAAPVSWEAAVVPPGPPAGSIYRADAYRPMFENPRARLPGDLLTVRIVEKISASQSSARTVEKTGAVEAGISALPGIRGNSFANGRAEVNGSSSNTFAGQGSNQSSNDFTGTITVTVRQVLPNGHLLVTGEKQIGLNHAVDILRFTGQVDPNTIQPGNTVASSQVGQVRLEHRGRGVEAEALAMGWLSRVFLNLMPF